jgi:hypothetical protein
VAVDVLVGVEVAVDVFVGGAGVFDEVGVKVAVCGTCVFV